jgi:VWFA-related protein
MVARKWNCQSRRRRLLVVAVAVAALPVAGVARKRPEPQASQAPKAIMLDLVALDNRGEPVTDLVASDLQVSDSGKPQQIVFFRSNFVKKGNSATLAQHEYSNRAHPVPPTTVVLIDFMNERTMTDPITRNELVRALGDQETGEGLYLYILTNRNRFMPVHPLNPEAKPGADERWAKQIEPLLDPVIKQIFGLRPIDDWDPGYRFQATLQSISSLGAHMAVVPGRKNLVWVSHGVPSAIPDLSGQLIDLSPQVHSFATSLEKARIAVYSVAQSSRGAGAAPVTLSTETLQEVSDLTGGRYYLSDAVGEAINQARTDSRASYTVGYFAPPQQENAKFHKVRVNSSRRGLRLNTVRGYYAFPEAASGEQEQAALTSAVDSPYDSPDIGLVAKVDGGASGPRHLQIHINPADLLFRQLGDQFDGDLLLLVFQSKGAQDAQPDGFATRPEPPATVPIHLTMTPEQHQNALKDGTGVARDIPLAQATEQVRLVVLDRNSGAYGSLRLPIATEQ